MRYKKVLEPRGKLTNYRVMRRSHTISTPQGGERVNQTDRSLVLPKQGWEQHELYESWVGLSSPLRTLPPTATLSVRHSSLTDLWQTEMQRTD